MVKGDKMRHIGLLYYQQDAIDEIFGYDPNNPDQNRISTQRSSEEARVGLINDGKRMTAVTLPTGGGKSFVAMETMIQLINRKGETYPVDEEHPERLSNLKTYYYVPNTEIPTQFATHLLEYVVQRHYLEQFVRQNGEPTLANVDKAFNEILTGIFDKKSKIKLDTSGLRKSIDKLYEDARLNKDKYTEDELALLENSLIYDFISQKVAIEIDKKAGTDIVKAAQRAFPGLVFKTYQSIATENGKDPIKDNPDLVIYDESHAAAAPTRLNHCIENAIENPNTFFLCLSATPERDGDDKSVTRELAKVTGYSINEVVRQKYYAKELYLADAIEEQVLLKPTIVHSYYMLDETKEFKAFMEKYNQLEAEIQKHPRDYNLRNQQRAYEIILKEVYKIIGRPEGISDEEWKRQKTERFREDIGKSGFNKHGKYIYFIPKAQPGQGKESNYENQIRFLKEYYGEDVEIFDYYTGTPTQRDKVFDSYKAKDNTSGPIKVLVACDAGSQGVHIPNDGEILGIEEGDVKGNSKSLVDSKITARNSFLQKIGRSIRAISKKMVDKMTPPVIVDMRGCFGRNFNHLARTSDVFEIPIEEKCFYELMEFADKVKELESTRVDMKTGEKVEYTFRLPRGKVKYRPIDHIKRDISGIDHDSGGIKNSPKQGTMQIKDKFRYEYLITILRAMKMTNPDFDFSTITPDSILSKEFVTNNDFYDNLAQIVAEQGGSNVVIEAFHTNRYELGKELETFRNILIGLPTNESKAIRETFTNMTSQDVEELSDLGFFSRPIMYDKLDPAIKPYIRADGFVMENESTPECLIGINLNNGKRFYNGVDEYGCDETGYDKDGFDRYGFNRKGFHRATGARYDERFFRKELDGRFVNIFTKTELDPFGYNHDGINPETGFDRGTITSLGRNDGFILHRFHKRKPDGTFSRRGTKYDDSEIPTDFFGFRANHTIADGSKGREGSTYTYSGYEYDGINHEYARNSYIGEDSKLYRARHDFGPAVSVEGLDIYDYKVERANPDDEVLTDRNGCHYNYATGCLVGLNGRNSKGEYPKDIRIALEVLNSIFVDKDSAAAIKNRYGRVADLIKSDITMLFALTNIHPTIKEAIMEDPRMGRGFRILNDSLSNEGMARHNGEFNELNSLCPSLKQQILTQILDKSRMVREEMGRPASRGQVFGKKNDSERN